MLEEFRTEHHARLNRLAGAWDTTIVMLDPDGKAGAVSRASDIYTWMPNGHFLVHDVDAEMAGETIQSTEIFGVDAATGDFFSRSYDADGGVNDFTARIDGDQFSIHGQVQRFTGAFSADGKTLEGEWRQLSDGNWRPFVRITLVRRA